MNDFEIMQEIFKRNNIDFYLNNDEYNARCINFDDCNMITLVAERTNNVEGYVGFFTNLLFDKKEGNLKKVDIFE